MANKVTISIKQVDAKVNITEVVNVDLGIRTAFNFIDKDNEDTIEVSDGHHTMDELYEHRHRLFIALCKIYDNYITPMACHVKCWKSKLHADGTSYDGWFLLGMTVEREQPFDESEPRVPPYQISYHLPMKYWNITNVITKNRAPEWDGHTSNDVLERLLRL